MQESTKYELMLRYQGVGGYCTDQIQTPRRSSLTDSCLSWKVPFLCIWSAQILYYCTAIISFPLKGIKSSNLWLQSMATISLVNRAQITQIFTVNLTQATEEGHFQVKKSCSFGKDVIIQGIYILFCDINGRLWPSLDQFFEYNFHFSSFHFNFIQMSLFFICWKEKSMEERGSLSHKSTYLHCICDVVP